MINKFDPDLNREIRRVVANFNRKRNRGIRNGYKYIPRKVYVKDVKESFDTPGEIERYLNELEKFNTMGNTAYQEVTTSGGAKTSLYNYNYVKDNLQRTKEYLDRQLDEARRIYDVDQFSMAKRDYLFNLEERRKDLDLDINTLSQTQFRRFEKETNRMMDENRIKINGYRGFLDVVEKVMKTTNMNKELRKEFFDKMSTLTPAQFTKMYRSNDLVGRIYEIIPSPPRPGEDSLTTSDEDAQTLITNFLRDFDKIKAETEAI